jgi:hypothetical protein
MALIFEDSQKVTKKQIPIPQNAKKAFKALKKVYKPYLDKNIPGSKILKSLGSEEKYNKKGVNSKTNGKPIKQDSVNVDVAKVRLHRMNKLPKNSLQYQLNGGELAANIYRDGIARARSQEKVSPVDPPKPTSNAEVKPAEVKQEKISTPNGKITYSVTAENRLIKESDDGWHIFYDYLEEYDAHYVLDEFFDNPNGKQNWGVLINPEMYAKALRELSRFGKLTNSTFPSKYVYQWMGIIMKNTAILCANTDLAGHSQGFPIDDVVDIAEYRFGIDLEPDYDACSEWLDEQGLYDWMSMPDGSDAWSDFGIEPLMGIIKEYNEDLPPEKVLVLVNRALDVYHQRGDMASIFVQGGSKALSRIAEEVNKSKKKIYISEKTLLKLKNNVLWVR